MKKIGLILLVLAAAVLLGGRWYYIAQVEKQLDKAASAIAPFGGRLEYRKVDISHTGVLSVEGLHASVPGAGAELNVERISLDTGSLTGIHKLATTFKKQRFPETLTLSLEGMVMPVTAANTTAMHPFGFPGMGPFLAAGCGERNRLSPVDYSNMGYQDPVFDTQIEYRAVGGGELITLKTVSEAPNLHQSQLSAEFSLGANSLSFTDMAQAVPQMRLLEASLHYHDLGFYPRLLSFCEQQAQLSRTAFIELHTEQWLETWYGLGLQAGPNTEQAYSAFIANPKQFALHVEPSQDFAMDSLNLSSLGQLLYRLRANIIVNDQSQGRLDISSASEQELSAWRQERAQTRAEQQRQSVEPDSSQSTLKPIAREQWQAYLGKEVQLMQTSGERVTGVLERLEEEVLRLKVFSHGGFIIRPFEYRHIDALYRAKP
ncbi:hypothetical protein [Gilvimarinus xylanilyticus]|uniref:Uncharacterized protein n=1 Tax=Gilvimarinus xylanilyticus TaxID=2944139 RepID=A0A9X2I4A8_9GAMM|nr:hypothetical protein [Gilvimarinus xylanilyticus]MCP8900473.1 hypothetical protein [Gilvimarinus xylanilyticus]